MSAGPIEVRPVNGPRERKTFVHLPWLLYREDPCWVPPLVSEMNGLLDPRKNQLLRLGPHAFFVAWRGGRPVGRIGVGADEQLNWAKGGRREGYFTLFESIDDYAVAEALFDAMRAWLKERGLTVVTGPQSPDNGDDYRGLLVQGFDSTPVLMDSYNPPCYAGFFERYGFEKFFDRFAYRFDITPELGERMRPAVEYAMKRYGFAIDRIDLKNLAAEFADVKRIIDVAMPEEWPDMVPPTMEDIQAEAKKLLPVADPDLLVMARTVQGEPIGFMVGLPDYNQVLRHLNGRLFPTGVFKYLWLRRRITGARIFILFVVPSYHKKGVSAAMYLKVFDAVARKGYTHGEGSTIHEFNLRMRRDAEGAGGKHYKTYRIYRLGI